MQDFVTRHRALILKHARAHVRQNGEKIAAEDVSREMELILQQLSAAEGDRKVTADKIESPDGYLRSIVLHAARRAKRRRTLIEQIAAGDDLQAISDDLKALDSDLPDPPSPLGTDAKKARATLEQLKDTLAPRDALIFALLVEDDGTIDEVARTINLPQADILAARARILSAAEKLKIEPDPERRSIV